MVRTMKSQKGRRRVSAFAISTIAAFLLVGCGPTTTPQVDVEVTTPTNSPEGLNSKPEVEAPPAEESNGTSQEEVCDWDSPRISSDGVATDAQDGALAEILVGSWQHTHTDDGSGFEEVANDHRFVFPSPDRMLYCQHVPGVTDYAENAADVVLNGTRIEWGGGAFGYTVMAWDADTMVWDNPVGGGYVYLLQRR